MDQKSAAGGARARLGILPLGTGNDLAWTLAIPLDAGAAVATLAEGNERTIDLIEVPGLRCGPTLAANVAAGGFSGRVGEESTAEAKDRWGTLAYVLGALMKVLPDLTGYRTTIAWDDGEAQEIDALAVLVANGRSVAGGRVVAPLASLEDGLLDVIVLRQGSLLDLAGVARLALGTFLESDAVDMRRARALHVESTPPMRFNVDGELLPEGPVTFRVVPHALRVIVGRDYCPGHRLDRPKPPPACPLPW